MNKTEREKIHDKRHLAYRLAMLNDTESKRKKALIRPVEVEESEILGILFESVKMLKILAEQPKRCFNGIDLSVLNQDMSNRKQWTASLETSLKLLVKLSLDALDELRSFNNVADEYFYAKRNADYQEATDEDEKLSSHDDEICAETDEDA